MGQTVTLIAEALDAQQRVFSNFSQLPVSWSHSDTNTFVLRPSSIHPAFAVLKPQREGVTDVVVDLGNFRATARIAAYSPLVATIAGQQSALVALGMWTAVVWVVGSGLGLVTVVATIALSLLLWWVLDCLSWLVPLFAPAAPNVHLALL